jgi:hypothetical protein
MRAEIIGIAPFFIVRDVPISMAFYREKSVSRSCSRDLSRMTSSSASSNAAARSSC